MGSYCVLFHSHLKFLYVDDDDDDNDDDDDGGGGDGGSVNGRYNNVGHDNGLKCSILK